MKQIGWETFARARAQLDAGLDREAVLAEVNVDAATWMREEESLLAELADDVERADFTNIEVYRRVYRATWTELTDLEIDDAPRAVKSSSLEPPGPMFSDHAQPVKPGEVSFQPPPPIVTALQAPVLTVDGPTLTLPFQPLTGLSTPSLPFQPPPEPSASSSATTKAVETSVRSKDKYPLPAWLEHIPIGHMADHTLPTTRAAEGARNPLPFNARATALGISPTPPSSEIAPGSPSDQVCRLTLEQYASLCAELAAFPQHVEAIFQRYGLVSLRERLTVDLAWQERLRRNAAEYREWHELYRRYQAYWADPARHDSSR